MRIVEEDLDTRLPVIKVFGYYINIRLDIPYDFITLVTDLINVTQIAVCTHYLYYTFTAKLPQHVNKLANTTWVKLSWS